jgi:hypothetical protein
MLALLLLAAGAEPPPPQFTVVNNVPPTFVVVNKVPPASVPAPQPVQWRSVTRPAVGHSHTCPRCRLTWDHEAHAGHDCPRCGTPQFVVDQPSRPVTVYYPVRPATSAPPPPAAPYRLPYTLPPSFGDGCPPTG